MFILCAPIQEMTGNKKPAEAGLSEITFFK